MANPAKGRGFPTTTEAAYNYPKDYAPGVSIPEPSSNYPKAPSGGFGDSSNYSAGRPMTQDAPQPGQACETVATQAQIAAQSKARCGYSWPDSSTK